MIIVFKYIKRSCKETGVMCFQCPWWIGEEESETQARDEEWLPSS